MNTEGFGKRTLLGLAAVAALNLAVPESSARQQRAQNQASSESVQPASENSNLAREALEIITNSDIPVDDRGVEDSHPMFSDESQGPTQYASFHEGDRLYVLQFSIYNKKPALFIESCYADPDNRFPFGACGDFSEDHIMFRDDNGDGNVDYMIRHDSDGSGGIINHWYDGNSVAGDITQVGSDITQAEAQHAYEDRALGAVRRLIVRTRARRTT